MVPLVSETVNRKKKGTIECEANRVSSLRREPGHLPKRQRDSGPVKSKCPASAEAAFHTVHPRRARSEASSGTPEVSGHESIDSSFLAWHGQPGNIRVHTTAPSSSLTSPHGRQSHALWDSALCSPELGL